MHPLYGPIVSPRQLEIARIAAIVVLCCGVVVSFWLICSLGFKFYTKRKQGRRNSSVVDRMLLNIVALHFVACSIKVYLRISSKPYDPKVSKDFTEYSDRDSHLRFNLHQITVASFEVAFMWEAALMLQIFFMIRRPQYYRLKLKSCWVVFLIVAALRIPNNLFSEPHFHRNLYDNVLLLIVVAFNISLIGYLLCYARSHKTTPGTNSVIKRAFMFPCLYLSCTVPRMTRFWVSYFSNIQVHRRQQLSLVCDILSYVYFVLCCLAFGLSEQCMCCRVRTSDKAYTESSWIVPAKQFEFNKHDVIGRGAMGTVYKGKYRGTEVAVKAISFSMLSDDEITLQIQTTFEREAGTLARLVHPNIVYFMGAFFDKNFGYIVCEFCSCGSLRNLLDYFRAQPNDFERTNWAWKYRVALGAARGLLYLHDTAQPAIIHRDLKSPNVLITESFDAKIGDFGTAKLIAAIAQSNIFSHDSGDKNQRNECESTTIGTTRWAAPEVLRSTGQRQFHYTKAVDIYSFGVVLWELMTYEVPFEDIKYNYQVQDAVILGRRPRIPAKSKCAPAFVQLVQACWDEEPLNRPTANDIVESLEELMEFFDADFDHLTLRNIKSFHHKNFQRFISTPSTGYSNESTSKEHFVEIV